MKVVRGLEPSEGQIQATIMQFLTLAGLWHIRHNSGTFKVENRYIRAGVPGIPDLQVFLPGGRVMWVEVKSASGHMSQAQRAFRGQAMEHGHVHVVARSVDDVYAALAQAGHDVKICSTGRAMIPRGG
jgi:hypothetical protein